MAANGLDALCSATVLRERTPATHYRKKENKCSNGRSSENSSNTSSSSRSKNNVRSTELQSIDERHKTQWFDPRRGGGWRKESGL